MPDEVSNREKIIEKARELGREYAGIYHGCAPATFMAIADALELEGREEVFRATTGLSGGIADIGVGACGAMAGATAATGLKFGPDSEDFKKPKKYVVYGLTEKIVEKFMEEFGSYICREIQLELSGKSFNLKDPETLEEFRDELWPERCGEEVIQRTAAWTVEEILKEESG